MYSKSILSIGLVFCSLYLLGQSKLEKKANKAYENFLYRRAISLFEKVEQPTAEGLRNLSDCYIKTQQYGKLEEVYQILISTLPYNSEDLWNYAEAVKYNQNYNKYDSLINLFFIRYESSPRTRQLREEAESFSQILNSEPRFAVYSSNVNTAEQEFSLNYFGDSVIFVGTGSNQGLSKEVWSVNQKPFLDLFIGVPSDSGKIENVQSFDSDIEPNYHYGPVSFNENYTKMVFTRNDAEASNDGVIRLQLYYSEFLGKEWSKEVPLKINSPDYSVGHPAIDSKNKRLYFASDMPNGYGGTDIYFCNYNENWELSAPQNMGPMINTPSNEVFPYYHPKGYLMFSSNGHLSLGGLDNYLAKFDSINNDILFVQNLGKPINSNYDDFSLVMDSQMENGYFSSDRTGGKGSDDIYYFFTKEKELEQPYNINLIVTLPNGDTASDYFFTASNKKSFHRHIEHNSDTIPSIEVSPGDFKIIIEKEGYYIDSVSLSVLENTFQNNANVQLQKIQYPKLKIFAQDSETKEELSGVKFSCFIEDVSTDTLFADASFYHEFQKSFDSVTVFLAAERDGYQHKQITKKVYSKNGMEQVLVIDLTKTEGLTEIDTVKQAIAAAQKQEDITKTQSSLELNPIFFDFDEAVITERSKKEMDA